MPDLQVKFRIKSIRGKTNLEGSNENKLHRFPEWCKSVFKSELCKPNRPTSHELTLRLEDENTIVKIDNHHLKAENRRLKASLANQKRQESRANRARSIGEQVAIALIFTSFQIISIRFQVPFEVGLVYGLAMLLMVWWA